MTGCDPHRIEVVSLCCEACGATLEQVIGELEAKRRRRDRIGQRARALGLAKRGQR